MAKTIKVGVLTQDGGAHLGSYLNALAACPEIEAVALADPSGKSVTLAKQALKAKLTETFTDHAELLKKFQPQVALISVEAAAGPKAIDLALDAGCHVLSEKPACLKADDFAPLVRKAQVKHRHIMLALANRTHVAVHEARRLIREGVLGKVYGMEVHLCADQTRLTKPANQKAWPQIKARAGGGILLWLGIHWLDLAMYITGLKVKQVAGFAGNVGGQPIDVEDSAVVALRLDNGSFGTMTAGYYLDKGYHSHIKIWGERGWLDFSMIEEKPLEWYSVKEGKVRQFEYPKGERGYTSFVKECIHACATGEPPPITSEECLHVLKVIFAAYKAAESGRVVEVT